MTHEADVTEAVMHSRYNAELLTAYEDADGKIQKASPSTLGILQKLLVASAGGTPAHVVISAGDTFDIGRILSKNSQFSQWQLSSKGRMLLSGEGALIKIPAHLPAGDYLLHITDTSIGPLPLLVTPREAYQPVLALHQKQTWLLGVQLYAVASPENWGHGDFGDLQRILEICAEVGAGGVGLNPLHVLFQHNPEAASPYAPSSRLFLNPLYLDLPRLPGYADDLKALACDLQRNGALVDYASVARVKYVVIQEAYRRFLAMADIALNDAFADYRQQKGRLLRRFAAFNLLQERHGLNWREWPEDWQTRDDERISLLANQNPDAIGMAEFAQWQCHTQLMACRDYARQRNMPIGLYLDVAVGSHPDGFDAWNDREVFLQGVTIGAPPDALNAAGQNWGLTAFNPLVLIGRGFSPLRDMLAATMEFAGAIRIDHILGLNRLYLIPDGASGRDGAYLSYPLDDLLAVLAHESQTWKCLVIGEDLGTVPQGFREQLQAAGIWTYIVALFERDSTGDFRDPAGYPYKALATFATHDLPPFVVWAEGKDIETLQALGVPASESAAERRKAYTALTDAIQASNHRVGGSPFEQTVAWLGMCGSAVIAVALEDIYGLQHQLNVPGTDKEYPNWRHRTAIDWPHAKRRIEGISRILHRRRS